MYTRYNIHKRTDEDYFRVTVFAAHAAQERGGRIFRLRAAFAESGKRRLRSVFVLSKAKSRVKGKRVVLLHNSGGTAAFMPSRVVGRGIFIFIKGDCKNGMDRT